MNKYLANQQIMYVKLHNLHWYVKGNGFFTLHQKFEELYDKTADIVDEVAERLLIIGNSPIASLKEALTLGEIKELKSKPISCDEAIKILSSDIKYLIKATEEIIEEADDEDDDATEGMFIDYLTEYQKLAWMIKSYIG